MRLLFNYRLVSCQQGLSPRLIHILCTKNQMRLNTLIVINTGVMSCNILSCNKRYDQSDDIKHSWGSPVSVLFYLNEHYTLQGLVVTLCSIFRPEHRDLLSCHWIRWQPESFIAKLYLTLGTGPLWYWQGSHIRQLQKMYFIKCFNIRWAMS